ncbi:uncharacterized protein LOC126879136 [Diabrotica virgifera virgifera]|uniref:CHK kinase-like domain-containing protein n=1 Tax=Diabrotica virgifera virgifera TaxID=50390 RepID=A0ABM5JJF3_DIAVI|nr:uncharacterized protein LOC126879136 [Diabrotica virgifera virgifera]
MVDCVKVLLKILPELLGSSEQNCVDRKNINLKCIDVLFKNAHNKVDAMKIKDFQKKAEAEIRGGFQCLAFKSLKIILLNTNEEERLLHYHDLIKLFYNSLIQKVLELHKLDSLITFQEYEHLVRNLLPLVTLEILLEQYPTKNQILFEELVEYLDMPIVLREDIYEVLQKKLGHSNFKLIRYHLEAVSNKGLLSDCASLNVLIIEENEKKTCKFFIKFLPTQETIVQKFITALAFKKEVLFYGKFVPLLKELGETNLEFIPESYLIRDDLIVLSDITELGYSHSGQDFLDYDHLSLIIKYFARIHSFSIIFEENLSKKLGEEVSLDSYFPDLVEESQFARNFLIDCQFEHMVLFLEKFPNVAKDFPLEDFVVRARKKYYEIYNVVKKSLKHKNVLSHGDVWQPNFFYKCDSKRKPCSGIVFDFQLLRYAPPALDILMLLHVNATKQTRDNYMSQLLLDYHNELKSTLIRFNIDLKNTFSFNDLQASVQDLRMYGNFIGTLYGYFMALPKEKFGPAFVNPETNEKFWTNPKFRTDLCYSFWDDLSEVWKKEWLNNMEELYELCKNN